MGPLAERLISNLILIICKNTSNAKRNNETSAQIRHEAKIELAQHTSEQSRQRERTKKLDRDLMAGVTGPVPALAPGSRYESGETGQHAGQPVRARRSRAVRRPGRFQARYRAGYTGDQVHA
jgi:hypothetical protein